MGEILQKLRPDRDLQCYFERPSAIAALSETSASRLYGIGLLAAAIRLGGDRVES